MAESNGTMETPALSKCGSEKVPVTSLLDQQAAPAYVLPASLSDQDLERISAGDVLAAEDSHICLLASSLPGSQHLLRLLASSSCPLLQEKLVRCVAWDPLAMMTARGQSGLVLALLPKLGEGGRELLLPHLQVLPLH